MVVLALVKKLMYIMPQEEGQHIIIIIVIMVVLLLVLRGRLFQAIVLSKFSRQL